MVVEVGTVGMAVGAVAGHLLQLALLQGLLLLMRTIGLHVFITRHNTLTRHNLKLLPIALRMDCTTRKHRPAQAVGNESLIKP
jgi:hypothetical protein